MSKTFYTDSNPVSQEVIDRIFRIARWQDFEFPKINGRPINHYGEKRERGVYRDPQITNGVYATVEASYDMGNGESWRDADALYGANAQYKFWLVDETKRRAFCGAYVYIGDFTSNCGAKQFSQFRFLNLDKFSNNYFRTMFESWCANKYKEAAEYDGLPRAFGMNVSLLIGSDKVDGSTSSCFKGVDGWQFGPSTMNRNYETTDQHHIHFFWKNVGEFTYAHNWR